MLGGCAADQWLWPFGSYWTYKSGGDVLSLLLGAAGQTGGTTTGDTSTGGTSGQSVPNVNETFSSTGLQGWTTVSGTWTVTGGAVQATGPVLPGYYMLVIGQENWTDYEVNLDLMLDAGAEYAIGVRWQNNSTWYHCSHTVSGIASIWKFRTGQSDRQLASGSSTPLPPGEWYNWRVVVQGNTITFYVEGEQVATATDNDSPITSGKVALLAPAGAIVKFDNVRITRVGG